ncbi:hypothetical protein CR513_12529, partial [Mucuna pruriens]
MTVLIKLICSKTLGGSTTFNVIDLIPCDASIEAPNLRTNSLQEGEDDAYMEEETPVLEGPITRGRLKRIQEESLIHDLRRVANHET